MERNITGRGYELRLLKNALNSSESEFIIIYGRRRVGKTYLVNQFFNNRFAFKITGVYQKSTEVQLERFNNEIENCFGVNAPAPANWYKAFDLLRACLRDIPSGEKKVVFIDEMPWMDTEGSDFISALEQFWNGWASAEGDIILIACGSATSWMTKKLLGDKGGLFNRSSTRMFVHPFTLCETERYLQSRGIEWTRYDIAQCYMIMGGIPFYLKQLNPAWSFARNIDNIFFREKGLLWDEFNHLYATLFKQPEDHIAIVKALAKKRIGLTRKEIIEHTKLHDNGRLTVILDNLANSEFIRPYNYYGKKKQDTIYQLTDFFTMFYFSHIKDNYGKDEHFWTNSTDNPSRMAWAGYTFEQLCLSHIEQIRHKIGISAVQCNISAWFHKSKEGENTRGAQIDLLIDRRDRVTNVCEMKYSINDFTIDKSYADQLRNKMDAFRKESGTRNALHLTMVTTYGVMPNMYSNMIQSEVTLDDLFLDV